MFTRPDEAARSLSAVMAAGPFDAASVVARCSAGLDQRPRWLPALAKRMVLHFGEGTRPRRIRIQRFLIADEGFRKACEKSKINIAQVHRPAPAMCPAAGAPVSWTVPPIATVGELARRLNLSVGELGWFAGLRREKSTAPDRPLRHYNYRWLAKRNGSLRLVESPKLRLKLIQRHLLATVLDHVPPHDVAHGFRRGRSILSFTTPHVGRAALLRVDLKDFFPSITRSRVLAIFLTAGYPEAVAMLLAGICTHRTPHEVLRTGKQDGTGPVSRSARLLYDIPHLPQGAPTSPALANLAAYRLDCRLSGLARAAGAAYTRYADDLVFSGGPNFSRGTERFLLRVAAIVLEEGFEVNHRKTRLMRPAVSQRAAGIVLNAHPNLPRRQFDELKAILHNCVKTGPADQNRDGGVDFHAHLAGRIAHVALINPAKGAKLRMLFDKVDWSRD